MDGPSALATCLRGGWSIGDVLKRYIFTSFGADNFLGRCAACLPLDQINFSVIAPMFRKSSNELLTEDQWQSIFSFNVSVLPVCFRPVLCNCLASVIFHRRWLEANLSSLHPLFQSAVWTSDLFGYLSENVTELSFGKSSETNMVATGVPRSVSNSIAIMNMEAKIDEMKCAIRSHLDAIMNDLPDKVADKVAKLVNNPLAPITQAGAEKLLCDMNANINASLSNFMATLLEQQSSRSIVAPTEPQQIIPVEQTVWKTFVHPNGLSFGVPPDYTFPHVYVYVFFAHPLHIAADSYLYPIFLLRSISVRCMWELFHRGNKNEMIAPFYKLAPKSLERNSGLIFPKPPN